MTEMKIEQVPIDRLKHAEYNPREISKDDFEHLKRSLTEFGFVEPLVVNSHPEREGIIIGGNQRFEAAKALNHTHVPVFYISIADIRREKELNVRLNKNNGDFDFDILANQFEVNDLIDWGFTNGELSILPQEPEPETGDVPEPGKTARAQRGMIYSIGRHFVMCGDSTNPKDVDALLQGSKAAMVFTDPPYGVSYEKKARNILGRKSENAQIQNDELKADALGEFVLKAFQNIERSIAPGGKYYVCSPQGGELGLMMMMMMKAGIECRHMIVWKKDSPVFSMGRLDYDYQHEPILYGWKGSHKHYAMGEHKTSIWDIPRPKVSKLHPTMKPVEVVENAILNSTLENDTVLDLFLGSGTTLIASEIRNRICYGMEIDPIYVDVIIKRFCNHTGDDEEKIYADAVRLLPKEKETA